MPKFHVVLDTNIYRKNPSRSDLAFQALDRLCKQGVVQLHLPYVVEREFQTQQNAQYKKEIDAALSALDAVLRKGLSTPHAKRTQAIRDELRAASPDILSDAETALTTWADSIGAQRHAITERQAIAAMDSYFLGKPPLKSPKVRDDIPDSFIYQTILELHNFTKSLVVVAEDDKLAHASEAMPGVTVHRSLGAFIESDEIQTEILDLDVVANLPALRNEMEKYELDTGSISDGIGQNSGDELDGKKVYSRTIPDDNHEATITGYGEPTNIELNFDLLYYFGHGEFGLPFTFTASVYITYYIFKADFYSIDYNKMPSVSDHNDHYYQAEDKIEVNVSGLARLSIGKNELQTISDETLEEHLEISIDSIDSIEVNE